MVEKCTYKRIEEASNGRATCAFVKTREEGSCIDKCPKIRAAFVMTPRNSAYVSSIGIEAVTKKSPRMTGPKRGIGR